MTNPIPVIKDVKARAVDAPMARPITTSVGTIPSAPLVLIDVVARLLGGNENPISAYDSYGVIDPAWDTAQLESSLEQGFKAIKIKIGGSDLRQDLETVAATPRRTPPPKARSRSV